LSQPLPMVPPAPAAGHRAASHGADGATHPDRRIDVDDPDRDGEDSCDGVDQGSPALLLDRRLEAEQVLDVGKALIPKTNAGDEKGGDQYELGPEHEFLPSVILAHFRQVMVVG